jgi:hypothetical protein
MSRLGPLLLALLAGCSTPHTARVRCDAHLAPINSAPAPSPGPLASTRPVRAGESPLSAAADRRRAATLAHAQGAGALAP